MIVLDKKSCSLLKHLLSLEEAETVMQISKRLGQSRRKIYYHLDKINESLPTTVAPILTYPRVGILLNDQQREACLDLLARLDDYSYVMNNEERRWLLVLYTAMAPERVTVEQFMLLADVSRNTVLNDLSGIRKYLELETYHIKLQVTKAKGYFLNGPPLVKIRYLYQLLQHIFTKGSESFTSILQEKLGNHLEVDRHFSPQVIDYLRKGLITGRETLGKKINAKESQFMLKVLPYLLLAYGNMGLTEVEEEQIKEELHQIKKRVEYRAAKKLAQGLQDQFLLDLDDVEVTLIAMLLLGYRKDKDNHLESRDYDEMRQTLTLFVQSLSTSYHLVFKDEEDLVKQLLAHCKSLCYRKNYGIPSENPLTNLVMERYPLLFAKTKSKVGTLEEAWAIHLSNDDIAYLTVHLGGNLRQKEEEHTPLRITLVCDEGVGIQKLFLRQCQTYLPQASIEAVFTSEQFDSVLDFLETDLVITTVADLPSPVDTIVVQPILTDEEIRRLVRFVRQQREDRQDSFETKLSHYVRQVVKDEAEASYLMKKLEKLFYKELVKDILE